MRILSFLLAWLLFSSPALARSWDALWDRSLDAMAAARKLDPGVLKRPARRVRLSRLGDALDGVPVKALPRRLELPRSLTADAGLARELETALEAASDTERQTLRYLMRIGDDALDAEGARALPALRNLDAADARVLVSQPKDRAVEIVREQGRLHEAAARAAADGYRGLDELLDGEVSLAKAYGRRSRPVLKFYRTYIRPHPGKWIAGGALVTFLADPDLFIDGAGNLTAYAVEQLGRLGLAVAAAPVEGMKAALRAACDPQNGEPGPLCALLPAAIFFVDYLLVPLLVFLAVWAVGAALFRRFLWFFAPLRWTVRRVRGLARPDSPEPKASPPVQTTATGDPGSEAGGEPAAPGESGRMAAESPSGERV